MHEEHSATQTYDLLDHLLSRSIGSHQLDQKIAAYFLLPDAKCERGMRIYGQPDPAFPFY